MSFQNLRPTVWPYDDWDQGPGDLDTQSSSALSIAPLDGCYAYCGKVLGDRESLDFARKRFTE